MIQVCQMFDLYDFVLLLFWLIQLVLFGNRIVLTEEIYGIITWLQEWMLSAPNENMHLPAPNIFIPTDLSVKNAQEKVW